MKNSVIGQILTTCAASHCSVCSGRSVDILQPPRVQIFPTVCSSLVAPQKCTEEEGKGQDQSLELIVSIRLWRLEAVPCAAESPEL